MLHYRSLASIFLIFLGLSIFQPTMAMVEDKQDMHHIVLCCPYPPEPTPGLGRVEYEPGERMAEELYNRGIGYPWIESEHHPEQYNFTDKRSQLRVKTKQYPWCYKPYPWPCIYDPCEWAQSEDGLAFSWWYRFRV